MQTITKRDLIDRVAESTGQTRADVKRTISVFLDVMVAQLAAGNRIEFREFGVFEAKERAARTAQNPRTLEPIAVPRRRTVKFKAGRQVRDRLEAPETGPAAASALPAVTRRSGRNRKGRAGEASGARIEVKSIRAGAAV